jgi:hypothetical protein
VGADLFVKFKGAYDPAMRIVLPALEAGSIEKLRVEDIKGQSKAAKRQARCRSSGLLGSSAVVQIWGID